MIPAASLTIAHLSDVHLPLTTGLPLQLINVKRVLGWLNWQRKRRHINRQQDLDALIADLHRQTPHHILISGDLINIGLPAEYRSALAWLSGIGEADHVSLVPGNHDVYVAAQAIPGLALWRTYMCDDAFGRALGIPRVALLGLDFPYVRRIGEVILIGVNSGIATRPGSAAGLVGAAQLAALSAILTATARLGLVRLIMIHHPPVPGLATGHRALIDRVAFANLIARHGAAFMIHGHNHTMTRVTCGGRIIQGVASASAGRTNGHEPLARYNLMTFSANVDKPSVVIETRGLLSVGGTVATIARTHLPLNPATRKATPG